MLPLVLLGLWAFNYLRASFLLLTAPGTSVDFAYKARAGVLRITAQSYSVQVRSGTLRVSRPRIHNPNGQLLAQAERAVISGLALFGEARGPARVFVKDVSARIVRHKDGSFEFEDYLPVERLDQVERPFAAVIEGVNALYVDMSGKRLWSRRVTSDQLYVEGAGQRWVATGEAFIEGVGAARLAVQKLPDLGLLLSGDTPGLQLAEALDHFKTTPEGRRLAFLRDVYARSMIAKGPVRVLIPDEGQARAEATLLVDASGVLAGDLGSYGRATFDGLITAYGARGTLTLERPGARGKIAGSAEWHGGVSLAGQLEAKAANRLSLPEPLRLHMPSDLEFSGADADGWLAYQDKSGVSFHGRIAAERLVYRGETFIAPHGQMAGSPKVVRVDDARAIWKGAPVLATVAYYPSSRNIAGLASGTDVPVEQLPGDIKGLGGRANVHALLSGTANDPVATVRAEGAGSFRASPRSSAIAGQFSGAGRYQDGAFVLTGLTVASDEGRLAIGGRMSSAGELDLRVAGDDVPLAIFSPQLAGEGTFVGTITGTVERPVIRGRVQASNLQVGGQVVPLIVAEVEGGRDANRAANVQAISGAGRATGTLTYALKTGAISGNFEALGLPLSTFAEGLNGRLDVRNAVVSGSAEMPRVSADLSGTFLLPGGIRATGVQAKLVTAGDTMTVPSFSARVAEGTLRGTASYDLGDESGRVQVQAENLSLSELAPNLGSTASVIGALSGEATLGLRQRQVAHARSSGTLSNVVLNETLIGSGPWSVNATPTTVTADVQLGTLERYLQVEGLTLDRGSQALAGTLTAYQIPLQDIHSGVRRYLPEPETDLERRLRRIEGIVDARVAFSGPARSPDVRVDVLDASALKLEGKDLGRLTAAFDRSADIWHVERVDWDSTVGALRATGVIDENGPVRLQGNLSNFDLGLLSLFTDRLASVSGTAGMQFSVDGPSRSPVVTASLDARKVSKRGETEQVDYGVVLDTIRLSESSVGADGKLVGGIEADGRLFYRGLEGKVAAHVPLRYPLEVPRDQPITASFDLVSRELSTLAEYITSIDLSRTRGTVSGRLAASGTAGQPNLTGSLLVDAPMFAIKGFDTHLVDATAEASVGAGRMGLVARGESSRGGTVSARLESELGDLIQRLEELASSGIEPLLDRSLTGQFTLNSFEARDRLLEDGRVALSASGDIAIDGPIRSPLLSGRIRVADASLSVPSFTEEQRPPLRVPINPRFNLAVSLSDPMQLNTGTASLRVVGSGTVDGSLTEPDIAADLSVRDGSVRLPTARVAVEPGGIVRLRYNVAESGEAVARLDVDLEGRTAVTDSQYGELPRRYEVVLAIRGDLFDPAGPQIRAESDPPGLSRERILALLGETDLIAGLVGGISRLETQERVRNALAGFAVPAIFNPLTSAIARGLGLEYLVLEYDPLDRITLGFARPIGRHFILQGRRELSAPLPGLEPAFEMKLTYRLPFRNRILSRTTVSLGFDERTPWKLSVEYSFRF